METQEQQYIKGFNHHYALAIHEPELVKSIITNKNDNNVYFEHLASGKQEYDMEKIMAKLTGMSRNETPAKTIPKDKGRGK